MEQTLNVFGTELERVGFPDIFDMDILSDIISSDGKSGSVADSSGDRIIEFSVVSMAADVLEILIDVDEDLYQDELTAPDEYYNVLREIATGKEAEDMEEVALDFATFQAVKRNPEEYVCIDGEVYMLLR